MLALWLAVTKEDASARTAPVTRALVRAATSLEVNGLAESQIVFPENSGVVHRLAIYVSIRSADARTLKVYLTSPSGTKALLADGASSNAVTGEGMEAWFGADGMQTAAPLAVFGGEPVAGEWVLTVHAPRNARLVRWSLSVDSTSHASAGMQTYGEYGSSSGGCDCRVAGRGEAGLAGLLALAGLALLLRRRRS
jgi:MYXO-CTERM domain-containing protein